MSHLVTTNLPLKSYTSLPHPDQGAAAEFKIDSKTPFVKFLRMYNGMCVNACTSLLADAAAVDELKVNAQNPELSIGSILGLLVRF